MLNTVCSRQAAERSILAYNAVFEKIDALAPELRDDMLQTISRATAWFAIQRQGRWYFGPSKYVGCENMTPEYYSRNRKNSPNGILVSATTAALMRWADGQPLPTSHPSRLFLETWAARYGRRPKSNSAIYLIRGADSLVNDPAADVSGQQSAPADVPIHPQPEGEASPAAAGTCTVLNQSETAFIEFVSSMIRSISPAALDEIKRRINAISGA